jgi:hypothetical protein
MHEKVCHLRYCRLSCEEESISVNFLGTEYQLKLIDSRFPPQKGLVVQRNDGDFIATDFLLWLSIYVGEDFLDPLQELDTRFVSQRGDFPLDTQHLRKFLATAGRALGRTWPLWKRDLFESSLLYYTAAVRSGVNLMPVNLGLFALSLECLGNVRYGKRAKHFTFGERQFLALLTAKLAKAKQDPTNKPAIKAFEKRLKSDIDLLNYMRNAFYGHSLLHLPQDRKRLVDELRSWMVRHGYPKSFASSSFKSSRLKEDIVRESFGLFKLGLRLNRLFIFLAIGLSSRVPFATHDFRISGDLRSGEESEFRGLRTKFISTGVA